MLHLRSTAHSERWADMNRNDVSTGVIQGSAGSSCAYMLHWVCWDGNNREGAWERGKRFFIGQVIYLLRELQTRGLTAESTDGHRTIVYIEGLIRKRGMSVLVNEDVDDNVRMRFVWIFWIDLFEGQIEQVSDWDREGAWDVQLWLLCIDYVGPSNEHK